MGLVAGRLRPDGDVAASAARLDGHCNHALLAHPWLIDLAMSGVGHWGSICLGCGRSVSGAAEAGSTGASGFGCNENWGFRHSR